MKVECDLVKNHIVIRIVLVLIFSVIIWNFINFLNQTFFDQEYNWLNRLIMALITTGLTVLLLQVLLKVDKASWKQLGQSTFKKNLMSFLLGFFLWTIPAAIGLFICFKFGFVEMTVQTDFGHLFLSIVILFITVFFMEALPEELIFRGYIYRYLNALFPHWGTIILQTLLFFLFAYLVGALYSVEQIQFIPGFAIILGLFRAISGNVWTAIGFHVAIMTATQILHPFHGHFEVNGMFTLQLIAFILLPSAIGATVLSFIFPNFQWSNKNSFI